MPIFQNEFSWSPSRHRMFEACKRQYYFYYYGSWGGWEQDADAHAQLLYRLKKMTTIPQLIGTVVHEAIKQVLKALQLGRGVSPQAVETYAQNLFDQHLRDSEQQRWRRAPSRYTNLFEHYYGDPLSAAARMQAVKRVAASLQTFFASDAYATLQSVLPEHYLSIEKLADFALGETKIWVVLDVAIRYGKSVLIFDWKTGRERASDRHQLAVYALYAASQWGIALSDLHLRDVYLQTNTASSVHLSPDDLAQTRIFVAESIQKMRALLDDPDQNTASQDAFPMTPHTHQCTTCPFKAACYPHATPTPREAPTQLSLF